MQTQTKFRWTCGHRCNDLTCIRFCTSHCFSPLLMTGWYFRGKITNTFQSHSPWLNTYAWPAGLRLTFNIWRTRTTKKFWVAQTRSLFSTVTVASNHNPKGNWGDFGAWDISEAEPQSSTKLPIKDIAIALSLCEPCFKQQQKLEDFFPPQISLQLREEKINMIFSKRHRCFPPACAGGLESQCQHDTADSRSGGLHMWWRTTSPAHTEQNQEAFLWSCGDSPARRHPCPTCAGKPYQYSCAKPSAWRVLTCTCQAQMPRSRNCEIQNTLLLLFPPFNMLNKIKHVAFPTDTQNEKWQRTK